MLFGKVEVRDHVLCAIAIAEARSGDLTAAQATSRGITEPRALSKALCQIAAAQAKSGVESETTFAAAIAATRIVQMAYSRDPALREIATSQAQAGQLRICHCYGRKN